MKLIVKDTAPADLLNHGIIKGNNYATFSHDIGLGDMANPLIKTESSGLRKKLLENQGYLCAFCMKRIPNFVKQEVNGKDGQKEIIEKYDFKIAHIIPQESVKGKSDPKLSITYTNMVAACTGSQGDIEKNTTCDTKQKNDYIVIDLYNSLHINSLYYTGTGEIITKNTDFDNDIKKTLNLNEQRLKNQRKEVYDLIEGKVRKAYSKPNFTRAEKNLFLQQEIEIWERKATDGKFQPFCMVAICYLKSKLK